MPEDLLDQLTRLNIQDFLTDFGLEKIRWGRWLLDAICWFPARRFARKIFTFDEMAGTQGLQEASRQTLNGYINRLDIVGAENIPLSGPVLILANHPGMSDTLALFSSIARLDLRIVAADRPFLRAISNVNNHLIYVAEDANQRISTVRGVVNHLHQGGVAVICPAGHIEPDPAVMPGAVESLKEWSESIAIFARLVPETTIFTVIISGVIWSYALHHPFIRLRKRSKDRELMAAAIQILVQTLRPRLRPYDVRVEFGPPIKASDLARLGNPSLITRTITDQARLLIERVQPIKGVMQSSSPALGEIPHLTSTVE
jgi:hypothetical protein